MSLPLIARTAVVTSTFYQLTDASDRCRASLAIEAARILHAMDCTLVVADGGSESSFLAALRDAHPHVILEQQQEQGMGAARRQAMRRGAEIKEILVYSELEKVSFMRSIPDVAGPVGAGEAAVVIPSRRSLCSYPPFQQWSEQLGNSYWAAVT